MAPNSAPSPSVTNSEAPITVFLCGDVMTGRGVDQILPHPGSPWLWEPTVHDARVYVALAERAHGPIPRAVDAAAIWGDALAVLEQARPDVRIANLETSVTCRGAPWPGKDVHYRMHPQNAGCLTAAGIDCCCLANNHVLDWGYEGLEETLQSLEAADVAHAGAGRTADEAAAPAALAVAGKGRVLVAACGAASSGIPRAWAAAETRPGINLLPDLSDTAADRIADSLRRVRRPGDLAVASIHWGPNWGYDSCGRQVRFAHRLVDRGVDVVHGHSSHHVQAIEVYRERLILYGCGDFLDDYEGISGMESFRSDLALMYLVSAAPSNGRLVAVRLVPLLIRRLRLQHTSAADAAWLCELLNRLGAPFGTRVHLEGGGSMTVHWR